VTTNVACSTAAAADTASLDTRHGELDNSSSVSTDRDGSSTVIVGSISADFAFRCFNDRDLVTTNEACSTAAAAADTASLGTRHGELDNSSSVSTDRDGSSTAVVRSISADFAFRCSNDRGLVTIQRR